MPEEEAKPDDETKSLRASALNLKTAPTRAMSLSGRRAPGPAVRQGA
jgi:hypothetical protein